MAGFTRLSTKRAVKIGVDAWADSLQRQPHGFPRDSDKTLKTQNIMDAYSVGYFFCVSHGVRDLAQCEDKTFKVVMIVFVMIPFWSNFLVRNYAWRVLLGRGGLVSDGFDAVGLGAREYLFTPVAVMLGLVYGFLPFMILPLYANMEKLDWELHEAAADLGARPMTTFFTVTLPMTAPGILAGSLLVFIPATGEFVIPDLLGGGNVLMIGRVLYNEFNANVDWPVASAVAIALLLLLVLPMMLYQHIQAKETENHE